MLPAPTRVERGKRSPVATPRHTGYEGAVTSNFTGKQRRYLRALAHELKPVVQIGHAGVTPGVLREIDSALLTHELIKIRVGTEAPLEPEDAAEPVEAGTRSAVVQVIGRTLVVYRRRKKDPKIVLPKAEPKK